MANHAQTENRNRSLARIDYRKAFDSIPHPWLMQILKIYKLDESIINPLYILTKNEEKNLYIRYQDKVQTIHPCQSEEASFKVTVFAHDGFMWYWTQRATWESYTLEKIKPIEIHHLLYMDNRLLLVMINSKDTQFRNTIKISLRMDNCVSTTIKRRKIGETWNIEEYSTISQLPPDQTGCIKTKKRKGKALETRIKAVVNTKQKQKLLHSTHRRSR